MSGKEHMIVGTTATATMGIGFLVTKTFDSFIYLIPLIIGGFIGSYMPDIDSHNSKARQVFNKILTFLIIAIVIGYVLGVALNVTDIIRFLENNFKNYFAAIIFCVLKDEYKELPEKEITSLLSDSILSDGSLTTRDLPAKWVFLEKLPLTPMSKIDFRALEKYDGNYTYIDSNEDNIKFSYNILSSDEVKLKKVI